MLMQPFDNFAYSRLRALVETHRARWDITPTTRHDGDGKVRPALLLRLRGRHAHLNAASAATCFECRLATTDLTKVAAAAFGGGCTARADYAEPCAVSDEGDTSTGARGNVSLRIDLAAHRSRGSEAAWCDAHCVATLVARLRELGAKAMSP